MTSHSIAGGSKGGPGGWVPPVAGGSGGVVPPRQHGFETLAIHAGQEPDPVTGAVVPPIYQVSTFKQDGVGGLRGGYEYSRSANPTRTALEQCLTALEAGSRALAFASGLAAEDCLIRTVCSPGDHVLVPDDAYGGTYRLFARVFAGWGLSYGVVPISDLSAVREQLAARAVTMVWVETPTNPLLNIADIRALARAAHEAGAMLVVDNTFASPYLQQPLMLGADAVVHSTTKYLGGHSDVVGGAVVVADDKLAERIAFTQNATGGVVSFRMAAGEEAAVRTCGRTRLFTLGESLGGVESLIEHPGRMTHASVTGSALEVPGDLIRLSVGIEDCDDLLDDLRQALSNG